MSSLDDRKSAFENKFVHDQELKFRVEARGCKLFGLWLAGEMGLGETEASDYAKKVVAANLDEPGFDDVFRTVRPDIEEKGLDISDHLLISELEKFMAEAKRQVMEEEGDE